MRPFTVLNRCFDCIGRCPIRQHHKAVAEVLVNVPSHECIHLVTARGNSSDVFLRQSREDQTVDYINTELVAATAPARVALETRIDPLRRIPSDGVSGYPTSRHAYVDKPAVLMPNRVDPGTETGDHRIGPVRECVGCPLS